MNPFLKRWMIIAAAFAMQTISAAPRTIYIKNYQSQSMFVWVAKQYLGVAPAGRVCRLELPKQQGLDGSATGGLGHDIAALYPGGRIEVLTDGGMGDGVPVLALASADLRSALVWEGKVPTYDESEPSPAGRAFLGREGDPQILAPTDDEISAASQCPVEMPSRRLLALGDSGTKISGGFAINQTIQINDPIDGATTNERIVTVSGRAEGMSDDTLTLITNGREQEVQIRDGQLSAVISLTAGTNVVQVQAIKNGHTLRSKPITINCSAAPAEIWAELTWDRSGGTDIDLHVLQPNGADINYQNKHPSGGGSLDRDDTHGPGPEHYFISRRQGDRVLPGAYRLKVVYYAGSGPVHVKLVVFKNERYHGTYTYTLTRPDTAGGWNAATITLP